MPYLTPEDIPEGDVCRPLSIPASTEWLALFSGALTELTKPYNWEKFGTLTVDETIAKMQSIIDNYFNAACGTCTIPGGYRVIRLTTTGEIEELGDDGEWVAPSGDYVFPPPDVRTDGSPEDQICLAAKNAVNVLQILYESLADSWNTDLDNAEALTALIAVFVARVGFAAAPIVYGIMAFFLPIFFALYTALEFLIADLWDTDVSNQIACFLQNCATNTDGVVTFDYNCFTNQLNSLANQFSLTEDQLRLYIQIGYLMYCIGGIGGLNLAGGTTAITDDDCTMCECTGDSIVFSPSNMGFAQEAWDIFDACGSHLTNVYGTGWYAGGCGGFNQIGIAGTVNSVCGNGINVNGQYTTGASYLPTIHIRVTTSSQVKNATFTPSAAIFTDVIEWDEGGVLVEDAGLVEIGFKGESGFGCCIHSFQTGNV